MDSRKLEDILGVFLAVMFLCILSGGQAIELPVGEDRAEYYHVSKSMADHLKMIPGISEESRPDKGFELFAENKLKKVIVLPEIPDAEGFGCEPLDEALTSAGWDFENMEMQSAAMKEEALSLAQISEPEILADAEVSIIDMPENLSDYKEQVSQTISSDAEGKANQIQTAISNGSEKADSSGSEKQLKQIVSLEEEKNVELTVPSSEVRDTEPIVPSNEAVDIELTVPSGEEENIEPAVPSGEEENTESTTPSDDAENAEQLFPCSGFLLNASGMIVGCEGVPVTDGVLCLPSDTRCISVSAGVLDSFGADVYEVYIPANIVSIEDGAFDGLTELFFIQVHPDNPIYGSEEGYIYEK